MKFNVAHVVYRNLLSQSGHGYPLWIPGPDLSLPRAYQERGITVGDVGILTERGGFDFLFNIHEAADSSANDGEVPPGFEPWLLDKRDTSVHPFIHKERGSVVSCNVSRKSIALDAEAELGFIAGGGFGVEFSTEKDQAAVLVLPHGATGYDAKNRAAYEDYAKLNAKSWCEYAESLGRGRTHLYLVTGCDKARSWGAAAVSQPSQTRAVSLKFLASGFAGAAVSFHSSWSHDFGVESRLHPPSTGSLSLEETQCVFTRGFTIAVRQSAISRVIKGTVGVSSSTSIPTFRSSSSTRFSLLPGSRPPHRPVRERLVPPRMDHNGRTYQSASPAAVEVERDEWAITESAFDDATALAKESDSDVLISNFPSVSEQSRNLSSIMCDTILEEHDDVEVAIVHDEAWIPNARQSGLRDEYFVWPESSIRKDGDGYATVNISKSMKTNAPPSLPRRIGTGRSSRHSRSGAAMVTPLNNYLQSMGRLNSLKWVETSSGPQNDPTWRVDCYIDGDHYGSGTASNKSVAKGIAAGTALATLTQANI